MTFALLIISRQEVEWADYFYTCHPNREQSDGQNKRLIIETAKNFEAVLFYKQKTEARNAGDAMYLTFLMPRPPAFIGRLACCCCISLMFILLMLIRYERRVSSVSSGILWLEQGEKRNM